jgi:phosphatidyl-myo-inositol alpha-mannosyltransferase
VGRAIGVPANGSVAPICFGPVAALMMRRHLKRFEPDVIHLHEPLIPSLSLLALLAARAPMVGTFHAAASSSLLYRFFKPALAPLSRRVEVRSAVSPAAAQLIDRYFPGDISSTPNGVDVSRLARAERIDLGPGPHVLFLGRLEPRKGAEVAVRAMSLMEEDLHASLVIAGEGPLAPKLRATARRLKVEVEFLGRVGEDHKERLFRSCDAYCAPNLGGESFGIVLVEAMAAGCPVVCSDLQEFKAVAKGAALFVRTGDASSLADGLRMVLSDPHRAASMREESTARAALYDWGRLIPELEAIYERAVQMHA